MVDKNGKLGDQDMIELTGKIMIVILILLFFVLFFAFCLHLYTRRFLHHDEQNTPRRRRRRRFDFSGGHHEIILLPCSHVHVGLDPGVLKSIPVVTFDPKEFEDGLECAVCLCEVCEGEKARILIHCNHGFHVECIDMWFQSHSTCPLCRNPVAYEKQSSHHLDSSVSEPSSSTRLDILRTHEEEGEEILSMKRFLRGDPSAPTNLDLENGGLNHA